MFRFISHLRCLHRVLDTQGGGADCQRATAIVLANWPVDPQ